MPPYMGVGEEEPLRPSSADGHHSHVAAALHSAREFLHDHNPLHGVFSRSQENVVPPSKAWGALAGPKPKVAHLTLEDMVFDDSQPIEIIDHELLSPQRRAPNPDGTGIFGSASGGDSPTVPTQCTKAPVVADGHDTAGLESVAHEPLIDSVDGPASDTDHRVHQLHHEHDPEHPSQHHHPDHLQAPHTKEEREEALIMSYLRAIPRRTALDPKTFSPPLHVYCGPLLRYLGLDKTGQSSKDRRETWRGSVMIVTKDDESDYSTPPTVRLFFLDPQHSTDSGTGERKRGSKSSRSGEKQGKYREIEGYKLSAFRGVTFWRFSIEVELAEEESRIAYRINNGPLTSFWVPAAGKMMNIMFHSCNGFSLEVDPASFSGPDPLWNDVLAKHQKKPFHVMIGGGDQIYNDAITKETKLFRAWLGIKTPFQKSSAEFTGEMAEELEKYYLNRYSLWFSQGAFGIANAQIPMVNIWDDHDIIDGYGSYPHHFNRCPVFTGLGSIAYKYYMLFQQQSIPGEKEEDEPTWLLGTAPGPYIAEKSRSIFTFLGREIALLGLDCRTERTKDVVLTAHTYSKVFTRLRNEINPGETKHLIVLLGVPIAYPRLVWLENILTSRVMDPIKALSRMGIFNNFINRFDGGVELLDDLDDHWTAKNHKAERNWFIQELQKIAEEKRLRITILGGDVHLTGIGQFMSNPRHDLAKVNDHRFMANVISSAIVNSPPPDRLADILNSRNKVHHLNEDTDEDMYPLFTTDVNGNPRNNKRLLPRRNFCTISAFDPNDKPPVSVSSKASRKGTFRFMKGSTKKTNTDPALSSVDGPAAFDGASESIEELGNPALMKDGLAVTIHAEIDQRNENGGTKPYRYLIPALLSEKETRKRNNEAAAERVV